MDDLAATYEKLINFSHVSPVNYSSIEHTTQCVYICAFVCVCVKGVILEWVETGQDLQGFEAQDL